MYIKNISIGSPANLTSKMLGVLDLDQTPLYTNSGHTTTLTPYTFDTAIRFELSAARVGYNADTVQSIGFGVVTDSRYAIIPGLITYNNSALGSGTSMPDAEYTEVDLSSADPPDNWNLDRYQYYYVLGDDGTDLKNYHQIPPAADWSGLRADLIANNEKLYYNDSQIKMIWIGDGENKVLFAIGRMGSGLTSNNAKQSPSSLVYARNCTGSFYATGGYIRNGDEPSDPSAIIGTDAQLNSWYSNFAYRSAYSLLSSDAAKAFTNGRFSTNDQYDNPICDCTLQQFGIVTYGNKEYFGIWIVTYKPRYYWGYPLKSGYLAWDYSRLDFDYPVSYDNTMEIDTVRFSGICLDDLDVEIETEEGEIPPDVDPDGSYEYPSFPHRFLTDQAYGILADATSAGFHVYRLSASEFSKLASQIWNWGNIVNTVIDQIENKGLIEGAIDAVTSSIQQSRLSPSDCIVFARKMPSAVTDPAAGILDTAFNLRLGGQYLDVQGNAYLCERIVKTVVTDLQLSGPTQTFLDMGNNVHVSVFLPYVGTVQLPSDAVIDGSLSICYAFDIISGQCGVQIITTARDGRQQTFGTYTGSPSVNIPLAIADSNIMGRQIATAKAAVNGITGAVKGFSKGGLLGRGGAAANLAGAAVEIAEAQAEPADFQQVTSLGSDSAIVSPAEILLQIDYPATVDLQRTIDLIGACTYRTGRVGDFVSPDMDKPARFSYIDTDGITATAEELSAIESLLKEGVYL